jgi:hypothetical protein
VTALAENLVLCKEHTVDTAHEAATLTVEIRVDLLLKGGLVEVPTSDGDTEGNGLFAGQAGDVLEDGNGGVDTTALLEEGADGAARALWSDEDDIDVSRDLDFRQVLEDGAESVGEVESLALSDERLDRGPCLGLRSVGEQVHDDGTTVDGLVNVEQVLAWDPAVLLGLLPGLTILSDTDDDIEAVVAEVEALAVALGAVADEGEGVVLEVLEKLLTRPVVTLCKSERSPIQGSSLVSVIFPSWMILFSHFSHSG